MAGHELTERDVRIIAYVARHGVCTTEQIAQAAPTGEPFFPKVPTAYRRVRALIAMGYLVRTRTWIGLGHAITSTKNGNVLAHVDLPAARVDTPTLGHALSVVDLSETVLREHPGSRWLTERELRRDELRRQREQGLGTLQAVRPRTPDGMLVTPDGRRIAVELDLTMKRTDTYRNILAAYAGAQGLAAVRWYSQMETVRRRIAGLIAEMNMPDMSVHDGARGTLRRPAH